MYASDPVAAETPTSTEKASAGSASPRPDSPDVICRNTSFRGYAAHTRDAEFVAAMDRLLAETTRARAAVMCSEALWWRCHRRLIADFAAVARNVPVHHLMHNGRLVPHPPTPGLRPHSDGLLVYHNLAAAAEPDRRR